jgi:hypothetical protein
MVEQPTRIREGIASRLGRRRDLSVSDIPEVIRIKRRILKIWEEWASWALFVPS